MSCSATAPGTRVTVLNSSDMHQILNGFKSGPHKILLAPHWPPKNFNPRIAPAVRLCVCAFVHPGQWFPLNIMKTASVIITKCFLCWRSTTVSSLGLYIAHGGGSSYEVSTCFWRKWILFNSKTLILLVSTNLRVCRMVYTGRPRSVWLRSFGDISQTSISVSFYIKTTSQVAKMLCCDTSVIVEILLIKLVLSLMWELVCRTSGSNKMVISSPRFSLAQLLAIMIGPPGMISFWIFGRR